MWCSTPTCSSIAKPFNSRFGNLGAEALQEYVRPEVADFARIPDEGHKKSTAQPVKSQKKKRPNKKGKVKLLAEQGPAGVAQADNGPPLDKEAARRRARVLKMDYPGIKDVPPSITKGQRKLLITSYRATHTDAQQGGPEMQPHPQHSQPSARRSRGGKKTNLPRKASQDAASFSRGSVENPIDLD